MIRYYELYQLILKHPYFKDGICDVLDLKPTIDSYKLMKSRNMLFRKKANGIWSIIAEDTMLSPYADTISIEASIKDPLFEQYTEIPKNFFPYKIKLVKAVASEFPGAIMQAITFEFTLKAYQLEYKIILRKEREFENLTLEDKNGLVVFALAETNDKNEFHFLSKEKVQIKESSNYSFTLYNIHAHNRKETVMNNVPPPVPGQFISPEPDILQTIVYI